MTNFKKYLLKGLLYTLGMFIVGFSVSIILRTKIGSGAWDAVNYNLHMLLKQKITVGEASQIIGVTLLIIILLYRRKAKYLITLIPILIMGFIIDLWNLIILKNITLDTLFLQILFFFFMLFLLPFGLAIIIKSDLSSMVFDEMTFVLIDLFKVKSFSKVRISFEIFAVLLAALFGLIAGGQLYEVKYGTVIFAITIGPLVHFYTNQLDKVIKFDNNNETRNNSDIS